jgi:hypothetical protein
MNQAYEDMRVKDVQVPNILTRCLFTKLQHDRLKLRNRQVYHIQLFGEIHRQIEDRQRQWQRQQQAGLLQQAFRSELIIVFYVRNFARNGTLWKASKISCAKTSTLGIYRTEIITRMDTRKKDLEAS